MKSRKIEILVVAVVLILQSIIFVICGVNKFYIHMDEAYSLGLASYNKTEIQHNEDFYDTWHTSDYYEDYISLQEDEVGQYGQVYENQKNDVHPPLYYLVLRFAMGFSVGGYDKWPGIIVNIVIFLFITVITYFIARKLFSGQPYEAEKAIVLSFLSSVTMAALTNAIYIRMYALSTLWVVLTVLLHIKLWEKGKAEPKLLIPIGLTALAGSLTHYYYLFFLFGMFLVFVVKYLMEKDYQSLIKYVVTMGIAGGISLLIFPYSVQHMFFGYRGQGFISKLLDSSQFLTSIASYLQTLHYFGFNQLLFVLVIAIVLFSVLYLNSQKESDASGTPWNTPIVKLLCVPSLIYFILVAVASPWIELRYIMAICGVIFLLVLYCLYRVVRWVCSERKTNLIVGIFCVALLISPVVSKMEPQVAYTDKAEIVSRMETDLNVPTIFCFNSSQNRFLDDILLFATVDESYVAKDMEYTEENIQNVFEGKDLSRGIVVFINGGQENDTVMNALRDATGLKEWEWIQRLNACDVYYIKAE